MSLSAIPTPTESPTRFAWEDPLLLDDQLSEEERLIRDTARAQTVLQAFF